MSRGGDVAYPRAFLGHDRSRAEKEAEVAVLRSQAALVSATNKAKGMVAEAEAEMKAVEGLAEKRRFELEWKRLEVRAAYCHLAWVSSLARGRKLHRAMMYAYEIGVRTR